MAELVSSLYKDFQISITTSTFTTHPVTIGRGVLQGDCQSPLLFNMCFNTLMVTIKKDQIKCLGYVLSQLQTPKHWLQFAEDTALVTALPKDNQMLLNIFSKWTQWADFVIRLDKCSTFGIRKTSTSSV